MTSKTIYVHIGTHKTGSTSLQHFLANNNTNLLDKGIDFYQGLFFPSNHIELHLATMRASRLSPARVKFPKYSYEIEFERLKNRITKFIEKSKKSIVFTSEGLSYLRHEDELEKLGKFFIGYPVKVLVYFRDKESFLDSYKKQLIKMGIHTSSIQGEFNYVESDSWLTNYCELVKAFELQFGVDSVEEMQYEREVLNDGSIVPSFLRKISCNDASSLGDIQKWLNVIKVLKP